MKIDASARFAIIGIGCRMPPNASSLDTFWKFLMRGGSSLKPVQKMRWDWRQYYDADPQRPGKTYAPKASLLDADLELFDPMAFGISPREAASLDPQQRLLLETAWEAFEDAGLPLESISGSSTGVFIGGFCLDHLIMQTQPSNRHLTNAHSPGGVMMTVLSNRISHVFNLCGPSLTLDTACSSSLVAIHYACQSLRQGECDMVLAGGVNAMTRPEFPIIMSKGHFLSEHGECRAFDASAGGYTRGEGAGIFVIKRLEDALAAGDPIHAVIRGSGVNQDGHTDGISLPNSQAQKSLAREVYRRCGVNVADVDYVEAHGTGTQAGDAAESEALHNVYSPGRATDAKLLVGSVKTNIGHLEAAAGVAGMLKAIGIVKNRQIPKNLHFKTPNPKIPFSDYCLEVVKETTTLPTSEEKPVITVGINSFGYGGTNAHIVLESAPVREIPPSGTEVSKVVFIPFSARSEQALRDVTGKYAFLAGKGLPGSLGDLAVTAAFRRSHLDVRAAVFAATVEELREVLMAASTGQPHLKLVTGSRMHGGSRGLVFVYTGMGPQWWGMGHELFREDPIAAATLEEIDAIFQPMAGWSLREAMLADESTSRMERTELAQPANFAIQVALTRVWASKGIHPDAVIGHSVGEVVSAYVAGVYSLEDAIRISFHRSHLQQTMAGKGAMLATGLAESEALKLIAHRPEVSVAAVNSFDAVTLSGDADVLQEIAAELEAREVFQRFLRVEVAYHSPQMDPLREKLLNSLADIKPRAAKLPLYSTAYGKIIPSEEWTAEYWWTNVRQPVHFAAALQASLEDGYSAFLEVGPHPVLGNSIKECAATLERTLRCFTSLRRKEPEIAQILRTLGELYCAGCNPDWKAIIPEAGRFFPGPQYPWQRERHWVESAQSRMERFGLAGAVYLNRSIPGTVSTWEVEINRNYFPFLPDHGVQDQTVFPGMGYIEAALALSQEIHPSAAIILKNIQFEKVLIVEESKLQKLVSSYDSENSRFSISSRTEGVDDENHRHCKGRILPISEPVPEKLDLNALRNECPEAVAKDAFYSNLEHRGLRYGKSFQPITHIHRNTDAYLVKMDLSGLETGKQPLLHPTIFDAAIQAVLYCATGNGLFVPFAMEEFRYFSAPAKGECYAYGKLTSQSDTMIIADVWLADAEGHVLAKARHMACRVIETGAATSNSDMEYRIHWTESPLDMMENSSLEVGFIFADEADSDMKLAESLATQWKGSKIIRSKNDEKIDTEFLPPSSNQNIHIVTLWGTLPGKENFTPMELERPCEKLIQLLQLLGTHSNQEMDVTVVTRQARPLPHDTVPLNLPASPLGATALVAHNEYPNLICRSLDLSTPDAADADCILTEIRANTRGDIAFRKGKRISSALLPREEEEKVWEIVSTGQPIALASRGRMDSLTYEHAERRAPGNQEVEIRVHRVALNHKDILKLEGRIHPLALQDTYWGAGLGMECAGIVERTSQESVFQPGDRVLALVPDAFRSYATVTEKFVVKIPTSLGMDAAGIPLAYLVAWRGLIDVANIRSGERVLIHHGSGGLGQAAIDVARSRGADIFTTAGSDDKRDQLRAMGIKHVFSSRTLDFVPGILDATNSEGVDVVIGGQSSSATHAGLGLLRSGGRYIDTGKKDIAEDNALPMRAFDRNVIYTAIDIDRLARDNPTLVQTLLREVFAAMEAGTLHPTSAKTFPAEKVQDAFKEFSESRHTGKLLVDFSEGTVKVAKSSENIQQIRGDGCYIVTGGTSGFGLMTGTWLAKKGAGRVILASRSGANAPGLQNVLDEMSSYGCKAEAMSVDITDLAQVTDLIKAANQDTFTLRGVIHGAMVLDDCLMTDVTPDRFRRVFEPKAIGAVNLANALAAQNDLDFLVFYSSVSALVGNRGQTSYVAANTLLDTLAHDLRKRGLPAISINWGALSESGVVARDEKIAAALSASGISGLSNKEAFQILEKSLQEQIAQMAAFRVDWALWHEANPKLAEDSRFRELRIRAGGGSHGGTADQLRNELSTASRENRISAIEDHLRAVLATTLKMSPEQIPREKKLGELGVDSLMVLELGLGIKDRIGVGFSAMEFLKGPNLQQLALLAEKKLWQN